MLVGVCAALRFVPTLYAAKSQRLQAAHDDMDSCFMPVLSAEDPVLAATLKREQPRDLSAA